MSTIEELANLFLEVLGGKYALKPVEIPGLIGDGTTTERVTISGSDDRVFFRPTPFEREVWEVIHREASVPLWHGFPCFVRWESVEQEWVVSRTDWTGLGRQEDMALRYVAQHATQHTINEEAIPDDPVWVYRRAIVALRGGPAEDSSFRLEIKTGNLPWKDPNWFEGGYGPVLTSYVPATSGYERWVSHYIDRDGAIQIVAETESHQTIYRSLFPPPEFPLGSIPIAHCILAYGDTVLTESASIWDARVIVGPIALDYISNLDQLALIEAEGDFALSKHVVEG